VVVGDWAKEIFGGLGDEATLDKLSSAIGDERVITPWEASTATTSGNGAGRLQRTRPLGR
jgi:hypothetical protein